MSECLADTQVLIYGLGYLAGVEQGKDEYKAAHFALAGPMPLTISAISWFELLRKAQPHEVKHLPAARRAIRIAAFDDEQAELAAELARTYMSRKWSKAACVRCRNPSDANPCQDCGNLIHHSVRWADYQILAAAVSLPGISTLYTFDRRLLDAGITEVEVKEPPHPDGELWAQVRAARQRSNTSSTDENPPGGAQSP